MQRQLIRIKADKIDPDKIKNACDHIFKYLADEEFRLLEVNHLISSMSFVLSNVTKNDPLRKLDGFDYSSSVKELFSCTADSNAQS